MTSTSLTTPGISANSTLDAMLAAQILVAWAGEGLCEPPRLGWWRTDLMDSDGGGDLFRRLFPKTQAWASVEALRKAALQKDRKLRLTFANPDEICTLYFWGFTLDEKLDERLLVLKRGELSPMEALSPAMDFNTPFLKADFESTVRLPNHAISYKVIPGGREITTSLPNSLELRVQKLLAALLPLAEDYSMPFFRVKAGS